MEKQFCFNYEHYAALAELSDADRELVREAERATANANAPYSKFRVGAAARLRSGKILYGSNFESEVYPAGLCAERTLMFYAQANYADDPIETLAIASDPSERECYPCGQCRQVMVDVERRQGAPMRVVMSGGGTAAALYVRALTRSEHVRDTGFGGAARRRRGNVALKYRPLLEIPEKCSLPKISSTKTIIC